MSLILMTTVFSGFLATRILLALNLENVLVRYPVSVIFAYLVFFMSVKLWLKYVAASPKRHHLTDNLADLVDVNADMPNIGMSSGFQSDTSLVGGGGEFSGGGASGSFGEFDSIAADSGSEVLSGGLDTGGGIGEVVENVAEGGLSALGEEGGIVAIVILAVLAFFMTVIVGAGVYLVYEAPFILSEAAFEFVLAASLVRGTKRIDSSDWMGSVLKTTWIPFVITLALAVLAGYLIHVYFPEVTRISELFTRN